jgi:DNA-3-methyladenine glycosylase II
VSQAIPPSGAVTENHDRRARSLHGLSEQRKLARRIGDPGDIVHFVPTLHSSTRSLSAVAPFDLARSVTFLSAFKPVEGDQELGDRYLRKALAHDGRAIVWQLRERGHADAPDLELTAWSEHPITPHVLDTVADHVSSFLSLGDDLRDFYGIAGTDPPFADIVEQLRGLHHVKLPSAFEAAAWSVLASHCPVPVARAMKRRIIERFGPSLELDGTLHRAFPMQSLLAVGDSKELDVVVGNVRRAAWLADVVEAFGTVDEDFLRTAPWEEAEAWLRRIQGIGEWSAAFVLLRGLGRLEHMPMDMKPMLTALRAIYGESENMETIAQRYGAHLGYWAFYLRVAEGERSRAAAA